MKVLIITGFYFPNVIGGGEISVQLLAEALVSKGHDVVVICADGNRGVRTDVINGVMVYYVGIKNIYYPNPTKKRPGVLKLIWHLLDSYNPFMAKEVGRILDFEKPDIVHSNVLEGFSVAVWPIVKERRLPLVHTLRSYYLLCPRATMFVNGKNCNNQCTVCRLYSVPRKKYSNLVDVVVGNSSFILVKHTSLGFFKSAEKKVIFNIYEKRHDVSVFIPREKQIRFGYIGRLHPTKGIEMILHALRHLPKDTCTLIVAGRGSLDYEKHLKEISESNVRYVGFVNPDEFFSQIDVLIVPSVWHDPLPRTAFEAYAYGVPVIGSRRGGIPEIVEEGETGYLFDLDEPEELVKEMYKFVKNPELTCRMRESCLKKVEEFAPERIAKQYLMAYQQAIDFNASHRKTTL